MVPVAAACLAAAALDIEAEPVARVAPGARLCTSAKNREQGLKIPV